MVVAFATSLVSLACQGCVSTDALVVHPERAVEPSLAMTLAMPGSYGSGALSGPSANVRTAVAPAPASSVVQLTPDGSQILIAATASAPSAFTFTGSAADGHRHAESLLGWSGSPLLSSVAADLAASRYGQPDVQYNDMSFGVAISASGVDTGLGFDVGVAPRVAIREGGDISSQSFGGELRFGQGLDILSNGGTPDGWYVFVGTDGEALVWDADVQRLSSGRFGEMQLTDQLTVGDLQAGMSIQRGGGELSISYIRREIEFSDRNQSLRDTEDFAGVTFTMRR